MSVNCGCFFFLKGFAAILLSFSLAARADDMNILIPSSSVLVEGLVGSYASLNIVDGKYLYFTNSTVGGDGPGLMLYQGSSLTQISAATLIASNNLISDLKLPDGSLDPSRMFTRPVVKYSARDKRFYAVAHVTRGYPPVDGRVFPALMVSKTNDPQGEWSYLGQFKGEVAEVFGEGRSFTSGMAFIVNDEAGIAVDHKNPMNNKFIFYNDFKLRKKKGAGEGLRAMYSADGVNWYFVKEDSGAIADLRPPQYREEKWIFSSVVKTPMGYYMYVSVDWTPEGPTGSRMLHSSDGRHWQAVGMPLGADGSAELEKTVAGRYRPKNVSLSYNSETNEIYVIPTTTASDHTKSLAIFPLDSN